MSRSLINKSQLTFPTFVKNIFNFLLAELKNFRQKSVDRHVLSNRPKIQNKELELQHHLLWFTISWVVLARDFEFQIPFEDEW